MNVFLDLIHKIEERRRLYYFGVIYLFRRMRQVVQGSIRESIYIDLFFLLKYGYGGKELFLDYKGIFIQKKRNMNENQKWMLRNVSDLVN